MRVRHVVAFLVLFAGIQSISTYGQQVVATWTDGTGNWSNPTNWSTLTVPNNGGGTTYNVMINSPSSAVSMDLSSVVVDRLIMGNQTSMTVNTGASLNLTQVLEFGGLADSAPSFLNNGTLTLGVNASMLNFASFTNSGTFVASQGTGSVNVANIFNTSGASLSNYGQFDNDGQMFNSGTLNNMLGAAMLNDSGRIFINSPGILNNYGLVDSGEGGGITSSGTINNYGTISGFEGDDYASTGIVNNYGTITNGSPGDESFHRFTATNLNNFGTVNNAAPSVPGTVGFQVTSLANYGTINNSAGGNFAASGVNYGTINNLAGPTFGDLSGSTNFTLGSLTNYGVINNGAGASLASTISLNNAGVINNSGNFLNTGTVIISSPGVFTTSSDYLQTAGATVVDGALTATGGATINIQGGTLGGTGTITGNVLVAGTMMPGDTPGTLTILGNYEQSGIFDEQMSPFSQAFLDVSGNVVLDPGTLVEISLLNGFNPLGNTFSIMDFSTLFGQFANGPSFWDDGFLWDVTYRQHEIDVTAVQAPEPGTLLLLGVGSLATGAFAKRKKVAK